MMSMSFSCCLSQEMRQEQRLTLEQRLAIQNTVVALRLELIGVIHDHKFSIAATCPKCQRVLSPAEVLRGFNQDPQDTNTTCPKCRNRFGAKLIHYSLAGNMEVSFLCPAQTLHALQAKAHLTPDELQKDSPQVYNSAIVNFGDLGTAFKEAGTKYTFQELVDWKGKVIPFLGRLPDTEIARCVRVSVNVIRSLRKKSDIPRFNPRNVIDGE